LDRLVNYQYGIANLPLPVLAISGMTAAMIKFIPVVALIVQLDTQLSNDQARAR